MPRQFQERPEPGQLAAAIQRSVVPALGTGGHCAYRDGQHVNQAVLDLAGAARVFDRAETLPQALDRQALLPRRREGTSSRAVQRYGTAGILSRFLMPARPAR